MQVLSLADLILTPVFLLIFYGIAYGLRDRVTNKLTKSIFIPALTVKLIGAITFGLIFQYYYGGGDTFNYFLQSRVVYEAFSDSFSTGISLLTTTGGLTLEGDLIPYASRITWFTSKTEYFIIRLSAFFSLFCFSTYTVVGLFFAVSSFSGVWVMYLTFNKIFPSLHKQFAIAIFYLPSVFFWGSGLMKDSITLGALGWLFYGFYSTFIEKKSIIKSGIITLIAFYIIYSVKVYILLSFLPPALLWVFLENNNRIKNTFLRNLMKPVFIGLGLIVAVIGATGLTEGDSRYDVNKIGERTKINTQYLTTGVITGSAYNIGTFDGSLQSVISVGPQAIIVALFRPFIWEVRNPVMLLSAIEASMFIYLTFSLFYKTGFFRSLKLISSTPILSFCFIFSLTLAFAVGTNSGNFGTLVRYKIPFLPFYLSALYIMRFYYLTKVKKKTKLSIR